MIVEDIAFWGFFLYLLKDFFPDTGQILIMHSVVEKRPFQVNTLPTRGYNLFPNMMLCSDSNFFVKREGIAQNGSKDRTAAGNIAAGLKQPLVKGCRFTFSQLIEARIRDPAICVNESNPRVAFTAS